MGDINNDDNQKKNKSISPFSKPLLKTGLFLEERIFLNKSRTKWLAIGAQPVIGGQFVAVVRLCENDSKYVTFTRNEIPHLFQVLENQKSHFKYEIEEIEKWWDDILLGEPKSTPIHFKVIAYNGQDLFQIGNKKSESFPYYIILGENSIKTLYQLNKLVWKMVNEVKTNYARSIFSDLVRDAAGMKDHKGDNFIWKEFLEKDAIRYCGANSKNSTIARDALTHAFEYFKTIVEERKAEQLSLDITE